MSFGFTQATSIAAWTAVTLITLPFSLLHSKAATQNAIGRLFPRLLGGLFTLWMLIGAGWVVSMYYLTLDSVADSWQLITGVVLFLVHAVILKFTNVMLWKFHRPGAASLMTLLLIGTGVGLICCSFIGQTLLVPGIIFIVYTAFLFLHMVGTVWHFMRLKWMKKHGKSVTRDNYVPRVYRNDYDYSEMDNEIATESPDGIEHIATKRTTTK